MYILTNTKKYTDAHTHSMHIIKIVKELSNLKASSIVFCFILCWRFPAAMFRNFF